MNQRFTRTYLLVLFGLLAVLDLFYAVKTPVWSPRDEIAHYDFIDQLGYLRLPAPDDQITDYTFQLCRDRFDWIRPRQYDETKQTMGLAGWSYEAQNPPLYYLLLAGPNRLMKVAGFEPTFQLAALRVLTVTIFLLGAVILIPVFEELSRNVEVSPLIGPLLAVLAAATNVASYSSLGNDALLLLVSSLTAYSCVLFWNSRKARHLFLGFLAASLGVFVKVTVLPLLGLPLAIALAALWADRAKGSGEQAVGARQVLASASPTLLVGLFFLANYLRFGTLLGSSVAREQFATFVKPIKPDLVFVKSLVLNSFDMHHASIRVPPAVAACFVTLLVANIIVCSIIVLKRRSPVAAIQLSCCVVSVGVMVLAVSLNRIIPGVHWHAFRHYYVALPFWWFAVLPLSLLACGKVTKVLQAVAGLALAAFLVRFLCVSF